MKKLLATTAVALLATAGAASAQSVLERVLDSIDGSTNMNDVMGTFANIAENIGGGTFDVILDQNGNIVDQASYDAALATAVAAEVDSISPGATEGFVYDSVTYTTLAEATAAATAAATTATEDNYVFTSVSDGGIDGSITTTVNGVTSAVAEATQSATAGTTVAYEWNLPTVDIGDLSTTALGAVNTGEITLGVNSTVDDAKTTSTQAVSSVMTQLGGAADSAALVLNVASNMTAVNGSITTTMTDVNGALASASTTALGAVNTGTITSGVNAAVQGIVGTSGQTDGFGG